MSSMRLAPRYTLGSEYILHISQWLEPKTRRNIINNMLKNLGDFHEGHWASCRSESGVPHGYATTN
jgi:hypothetical protein